LLLILYRLYLKIKLMNKKFNRNRIMNKKFKIKKVLIKMMIKILRHYLF
jgi:hypothetical protein